ncbi:MAG: glycoside hydrolase family 9 protein [Anaerolineae bacterium]|nr:glycoside hydrolase family 9 protein [Anaerolineae bacterium]
MKTKPTRLFIFAALLAVALVTVIGFITRLSAAAGPEPAAPTDVIELIGNGDFSAGLDPWWTTPSITPNTGSGELEAVITSGGSNPWDAIVGQHGIPVQAGEPYTLTFDARASTAVTITVLLQEDGGSFTQYFATAVPLTTGSQTFSYTFTPANSDPAATFQYHIGGQGEFTFYLDNVSLLGPEPVVPPPATVGELLANGDFSEGLSPWWTTASISPDTSSGELAAVITSGGGNPWDAIVGQHNIPVYMGAPYTLTLQARASQAVTITVLLQENGGTFTQYFNAPLPLTTGNQTFTFYFTSPGDNQAASFQFHMGGQGEFTVYLDDISLFGPVPDGGSDPLPNVRVNQVGYLPQAVKRATISNTATLPLTWTLYDVTGTAVITGSTTVHGLNVASDEHVHIADFSAYQTPGTDYTLEVDGESSHPFDISADIYDQMKYDALAYFYHNRSGITLTMPYAGDPQWTRPAGHIGVAPNQGDDDVPCFDEVDVEGAQWHGCNYTLDVVGGWYDAGDHGKYVVNGGISVWTLMNQYERTQHLAWADGSAIADGTMNIPENSNGVPDILDEARWQMEFMLAMQVPAGGVVSYTLPGNVISPTLVEGMAHHKIADRFWTGLGLAPHEDPQPRFLYPPSTAATLNLAATAAQCARIWADIDAAFADRCLAAAETAWAAAVAHPAIYARNNFTGSGPYDDTDVSDEFYWAAAELYITTGDTNYLAAMSSSPHYLTIPDGASALSWQQVAGLGTISLALAPNDLPTATMQQARQAIIDTADDYVAARDGEGYLLPYAPGLYPWGSNSSVVNNMLILALAYDFTAVPTYFDAVSDGMDYLLGRNPNDQSYVTGYGERPLRHPHHRFWADQVSSSFPPPPPGAFSGGPNSGLEDPYAQTIFPNGCPPQRCFVDHIESWSTNEITINWNAPFAWVTAFLDEQSAPEPEWVWFNYLPVIQKAGE